MANTLKMLTSQLSNVHFTRMFILLVDYGLVYRGDCINCETCYFHFALDFVNICIAVCGLPTCVWWLSGVWGSVPGGT